MKTIKKFLEIVLFLLLNFYVELATISEQIVHQMNQIN